MATARFAILMDFSKHRSRVAVDCRECSHSLTVQPKQLADAFGWTANIGDVEKKLVCSECGKKAARLVPVPDGRVVRRLPLDR